MSMFKNLIFGVLLIILVDSKCVVKTTCGKDNATNAPTPFKIEYSVIVDAGESGNRFYVYDLNALILNEANADSLKNLNAEKLSSIELLKCTADGAPLHKIYNLEEMKNNFKPCIDRAKSVLPENKLKNTLIYLAATSGMRLLSVKNKARADELLAMVSQVFSEEGKDFGLSVPSFNRILNGRNEGSIALLQTNIITNNMKTPYTDSFGIMDMGSGSKQTAYVPKVNEKYDASFYKNLADSTEVRNFHVNYARGTCPVIDYMYATSQDCYGQNEFRYIYYASLISKHVLSGKSSLDVDASCLPTNSRVKLDENFFNSICTLWQFAPAALKIERNILGKYTLVGQSDGAECKKEIKELMDTPECVNNTCNFQNELQPAVDTIKFKAINGFFFAIDNAKRLVNKNNFTMEEFVVETTNMCGKSIQQLAELNNNNNDGQLDDEFVLRQCFLANYVLETLKNNGFSSFDNIDFIDKVNNLNFGWTLGMSFLDSYLTNKLTSSKVSTVDNFGIDRKSLDSKALRTILFLVYF